MGKGEPMLERISAIYAKDIYAEEASNPTSRFVEKNRSNEYSSNPNDDMKAYQPWDSQMMWNYFLVRDFYACLKRKKWIVPVIKGFIDQKTFRDAGNKFSVMVIARRSRHFAGTRFLRRGINHEGHVANWVEIE